MFLAFSLKDPKDENTLRQKALNFIKNGILISLAELITYPFFHFRVRSCSYPFQPLKFQEASLSQKINFGFSISLQKTLLTFFLRNNFYQFYLSYFSRITPDNLRLSQNNEGCFFAGFLSASLLNLWNVTLIKSQCSPFRSPVKKAKFTIVLSEIKACSKNLKNNFSLWKTGYLSFCFLNVAQGIIEIELFLKLYEKFNGKKIKTLFPLSVITTVIISPIEFLNTRYVLRKIRGLETPNIIKYSFLLVQKEGLLAFYRGFLFNFVRHFLFNCLIFKSLYLKFKPNF